MRKPRTNRVELRREISSLLGKVSSVRLCEQKAAAPQEQFLLWILKSEIANRDEVRRARFLREAAFPVYKTLEGFEFTSVKLPPSLS